MASLVAKPAFDGLLPLKHGRNSLSAFTYDKITWVAPYKGKLDAVSKALETQIGAPFPAPNRMSGPAVWVGPMQALVLGAELKPIEGAAMIDHSSAWAVAALQGPDAAAILSRLVPIDLRDGSLRVGHAARTLLGHMNCVVMRPEKQRFEVMVFRSMARTCAHEIGRAMRMVAARTET